ncbi:MAG: OmpH family outer membrane protein [Gammaproteobacteria bacterium]|nr:OmpH family outer membrane protein [Gammaproteobacteria bacterium]MBU1446993.1 OmpH family outer membrane protein [Gammaproteobacteria bacterium]MDD2929102.1 OmpH family outer membrane protein [Sideroxydans sp.]
MKNIFVAFVFGTLIAANAQAGDFRIGIVDTERILRESAQALSAQKKIDKEFAVRDQEIKKLAGEIKDAQDDLDKNRSKMSDSSRRIKEREIANLNLQLQTRQREFREDLSLRQNEELAQILAKADKAIRAIAESEQYDVILQEAVYRNPRVDITDKVLKYLEGEPLSESDK